MDAETQSRLVTLPSMLMTYLTGAGITSPATASTTTTTTTTTPLPTTNDSGNSEVDSDHAVERSMTMKEPTTSTPAKTRKRLSLQPHTPQSTAPPSPTRSSGSSMYPRAGETEHMSTYASDDVSRDGLSREGSLMSRNGRSRKRMSRPRTCYNICHPPPKASTRSMIHVRTRPLLQLHKHAVSARPMPAFDLLPSAIFSSSLARAIAKFPRPKHGQCPADLAIVKADKYHQHEESGEDETRDVLALICKERKCDGPPGRARIFLDDGSEWDAFPMANGGYEFSSTDKHGLVSTARWVPKRPRGRRSQSASELDSPRMEQKKFSFSTISPSSRRHPIIANLTSTTLEVHDCYHIPGTLVSSQADDASSRDPIETTAALHTLITATGLWVALREGWSPGHKYEDSLMRSSSSKLISTSIKALPDFNDGSKENGPRRSGSVARIMRTAGTLKRRSTGSAPANGSSEDVVAMSRNSSVRSTTAPKGRARAESTSTVIHNRTTWPRPDMHAMRKHTAASTSTYGFGIETGEDMTEEDGEEDDDKSGSAVVTPSKRASAPASIMPSAISPPHQENLKRTPDFALATPIKRKRESSTTDATTEAKKLEAGLQARPRRSRIMKVLLCGMA